MRSRLGADEGPERGAVAVMVAAMLPVLVLFLAFVIDTGNAWVHKRHLELQAYDGAFAGALGPWVPFCDDTEIIERARQYAGFPSSKGAPENVLSDFIGNTGAPAVAINSAAFPSEGGTDFSEDGLTPCQTLLSPADPDKPAYLDVKITEDDAPLFFGSFFQGLFGGFSVWDAINAHARVEIQNAFQEEEVRPLAVRDDSAYLCARVILVNASTGATIQSIDLPARTRHDPDQQDPTSYTQFTNPGGTEVFLPQTAQSVYVRAALGDCAGSEDVYPQDDRGDPVDGVSFLNVYSTAGPQGATPALHSVWLSGSCAPDSYFSSPLANPPTPDPCGVTVTANVEFPAGAQNPQVTINGAQATQSGNLWSATFSVPAGSGPQPYRISWKYGPGNKRGDFGLQQQHYSGTDDPTAPSSSGRISLFQVGCVADCPSGMQGTTSGANTFPKGTSPTLQFTVRVNGLANSKPQDPPIILRFGVQSSKRTGAIDCGQGSSGGTQLKDAVIAGCPSPVYEWAPPADMISPNDVPAPEPINAVVAIPGNKVGTGVVAGLEERIGTSCNHWNAYRDSNGAAGAIPADDPRLITIVVTTPANLSGGGGANVEIPVLVLATFYVTGVGDLVGNGQGCNNEPFPGKGNPAVRKSSVWGHWIKYVKLSGIGRGSGQPCNPNQFGDCIAVLVR